MKKDKSILYTEKDCHCAVLRVVYLKFWIKLIIFTLKVQFFPLGRAKLFCQLKHKNKPDYVKPFD